MRLAISCLARVLFPLAEAHDRKLGEEPLEGREMALPGGSWRGNP